MQSVRSNGSLPVALLMMMMVGEDIVFCANVMVLQLSFILSCAGLVVAGLIMCEHQSVGLLYKRFFTKFKNVHNTGHYQTNIGVFLWTPYMRFFWLSGQRF
jgi:hypothetical protein